MKVGDKYPVSIAGQLVAEATVREVGDGTVTLVVPATLVTMATRTELSNEAPPVDTSGTETIIDSVERAPAAPVNTPVAPEPETKESAPVAVQEQAVITTTSVPTTDPNNPPVPVNPPPPPSASPPADFDAPSSVSSVGIPADA